MTRLPEPGKDAGVWGDILNDFLSVSHNADGSLKGDVFAAKADNSAVVHRTGDESISGVKTFTQSPVVPTPTASTQAATKAYVDGVAGAGAPDATTASKGIVQLAGDLAGSASAPIVPGLAGKQPLDADLTAIAGLSPANDDLLQRKAGAWVNRTPAQVKTDLALTNADVGLSAVTNDAQLKAADLDTDGTLTANSDTKIASQRATKTYVDAQVSASATPDATASVKGKIQLAGDLGGTAAAPTVPTAVKKGDLVFNVKDYGAVADSSGAVGNGTDNLAAFTAAQTAASAAGYGVYVPAGKYRLSGGITLGKGQILVGAGGAALGYHFGCYAFGF